MRYSATFSSASPARSSAASTRRGLPHPAGVLPLHRVPRLAAEGLLELGHVREAAVHAVAPGRVGVDVRPHSRALLGLVLAPDLAPAEEEALLGGETVDESRLLRG